MPASLPPDHPDAYLRQWRLARLVEASGPPGSMLNAGDCTFALASYLPGWVVITADRHRPPPGRAAPRFLRADLTAAPLADGAVDVVVSTDVLEHLPANRRGRFLAEALRVARRHVFVAFPAGPDAAAAEALILRSKSRRNFRAALEEHARLVLPELADVEATVAGLGASCTVVPLTTVAEWLTSFVFDENDGEDYGLLEDYCGLLNGAALPAPGPGPVYRWLVSVDLR